MLRYKGVLNMKGTERKVIFQGVHQLMGSDLGRSGPMARSAEQDGVHRHRPAAGHLPQGLEQCLVA
jgi:G3E family GTPase